MARRYSNNTEDAKEILSNAFLRVFKKLDLFDPEKSFENWFGRLIIHASSDYYRYAKQQALGLEDHLYEIGGEDSHILDRLSYEELISCVSYLSPQYRAVFNLFVVDGYKHPEIAKLLGISIGTSKSNLSKAKRQLQKILNDRYAIGLGIKKN